MEGSYDEISITIVTSYTGKYHPFVAIELVTCNNTNGNRLVIFSSIACYYGDTCILCSPILSCFVPPHLATQASTPLSQSHQNLPPSNQNQRLLNRNLLFQSLLNQNLLSQSLLNQNLLSQSLLNQNLLSQSLLNQSLLNQSLLNQSLRLRMPGRKQNHRRR